MSHIIEILENSEIIKITHKRIMTIDQRTQVLHELCSDFNLFKRFRLLIDVRFVKQEMTDIEQVIFGKYISSRSELKTAVVAILVNIEQPIDEVINQEASKEGLTIKQFGNEEQAIEWLSIKN